jgi:HAD superfamily hydrolase (TIGR01549 family)
VILLADLDNTLIDRAGAFVRWAGEFVAEVGGDEGDLRWLLGEDADGYAPRAPIAERMKSKFGLADDPARLVERLMLEHLKFIALYEGVRERLDKFVESGVHIVVVTNGSVDQQTRKLRLTGLEPIVSGAVISGAVGVKKPDPKIFEIALDRVGGSAADAWMIGDHAVADMTGARNAGIRSAWVSHDHVWTEDWRPEIIEATTAMALDRIRID